jgi:hypothetical protein
MSAAAKTLAASFSREPEGVSPKLQLSERLRRRQLRLPHRVFEAPEQQPRSDARCGDFAEVWPARTDGRVRRVLCWGELVGLVGTGASGGAYVQGPSATIICSRTMTSNL